MDPLTLHLIPYLAGYLLYCRVTRKIDTARVEAAEGLLTTNQRILNNLILTKDAFSELAVITGAEHNLMKEKHEFLMKKTMEAWITSAYLKKALEGSRDRSEGDLEELYRKGEPPPVDNDIMDLLKNIEKGFDGGGS
jgi:hypothetical protein